MNTRQTWSTDDLSYLDDAGDWRVISNANYRARRECIDDGALFRCLVEDADMPRALDS
jgi:hypothetical protein